MQSASSVHLSISCFVTFFDGVGGFPGSTVVISFSFTQTSCPLEVTQIKPLLPSTSVVLSDEFAISPVVPRTPATAVGVVTLNSESGFASFSALNFTLPENMSRSDVTFFVLGSISMFFIVKFVNGVSFTKLAELHFTTALDLEPVLIAVPAGSAIPSFAAFHDAPGVMTWTSPETSDNVAVTGIACILASKTNAKPASKITAAMIIRIFLDIFCS